VNCRFAIKREDSGKGSGFSVSVVRKMFKMFQIRNISKKWIFQSKMTEYFINKSFLHAKLQAIKMTNLGQICQHCSFLHARRSFSCGKRFNEGFQPNGNKHIRVSNGLQILFLFIYFNIKSVTFLLMLNHSHFF